MDEHRLSISNIAEAARVIDPVFLNSPQYECEPLSESLGVRTLLKVETCNPIRCFKGRGADYFVTKLDESEGELVCASAGNFGQAMAYACRKRGVRLTVFASVNANRLKIERMEKLGAKVVLEGEDFDAAKLAAKEFAAASGISMIEDGLQPAISEGAGSIEVEILRYQDEIDAVFVPLGNGAMLGGIARILKHHRPRIKVIAVQAERARAMADSLLTRSVVVGETAATIADGIGVRIPIPEALDDLYDLVDDVVLVSESSMIEAMQILHLRAGLLTEQAGAAGIAAILEHRGSAGLNATIICGGNLPEQQIAQYLT